MCCTKFIFHFSYGVDKYLFFDISGNMPNFVQFLEMIEI